MGISSRVHSDGNQVILLVAAADAADAEQEIAAYVRENTHQPPAPLQLHPSREALFGAAVYACLLTFLHAAAMRHAFGLDWFAAGAAQAGKISHGQLWRSITALGLHGDGSHLLGNLAFGGLFGFLLAQLIGAGLAWLAILLAGIFGNLLAAQLHPAPHTSIGASTAVFGALGLLVVLSWLQQAPRRLRGLRRWMPFAAGAMLFAYLGIGDERTDVLAHVTGCVGGVAGGLLLAWVQPSLQPERQLGYGIGALFVFSLAWILALAA